MTTTTLTRRVTLESTTCCVCDITFAAPDTFLKRRREDAANFFCPNGHSLSFRESEATRLRRQLDAAQRDAVNARAARDAACDQADAAERSRAALKGVITKQRKRIAAGVCPCCRRSFQALARHMASQHPGFVAADPAGESR